LLPQNLRLRQLLRLQVLVLSALFPSSMLV
jgi:hypothetical protein